MDPVEALAQLDRLERCLKRAFQRSFDGLPITDVQGSALCVVLLGMDAGRKVRQKDVEDALDLRAASVTSLVNGLVAKGLLTRKQDAMDGRVRHLAPTEEGRRVGALAMERIREFATRTLHGISAEELATALRVGDRLRLNCQKED